MFLGVLCFIYSVHIHITTKHNARNTDFIQCEYQTDRQTIKRQQRIIESKKSALVHFQCFWYLLISSSPANEDLTTLRIRPS